MAVTKQKRTFMNQPIGVTRFETGESQMWEAVANTANKLNEIAFKEGAKKAEQFGFDAAMAVSQADLVAFDAETGAPKALDPSLFSGGIVAREASNTAIQSRFRDSIETELKTKAAELQLEYRYNPSRFREEMSRYVADMHSNAQGKWKETIKVAGTAIVNSTGLFIESETKKQQDRVLGDYLISKGQNFLDKDLDNILNSGDLEKTSFQALETANEIYQELLNGASANEGYVVSSQTAETFKTKVLERITGKKLQYEFNSPLNNIELGSAGNQSRLNILAALQARNSSELTFREKIVYDKIYEFAKEQPAILDNVVNQSKNFILNQNQNAIINTANTTAFSLANQEKDIRNQTQNLNAAFGLGNYLEQLQDGGSISQALDDARDANTIFVNKNSGNPSFAGQVKLSQERLDAYEKTIASNIMNKLVVGKNKSTSNAIRSALDTPGNIDEVLPNATEEERQLIKFFFDKGLKKQGFDQVFNTAINIFAGNEGKKRDNEIKLSWQMSIDFEKFAQNNDYETTLEESKKYYSAISKDGELQNLIAGSVVRYKNSLNKILIDKSASRLKFNGTAEVIAARNYIEGTSTALDNLPEIKKIIDETRQMDGITKTSFNSTLAAKYTIHSRIENNLKAEQAAMEKMTEITNGQGTSPVHAELADNILSKLLNNKTHRENLTQLNNAAYINQLSNFVTLGTIPKTFKSSLENLANNLGNYTEQEASALLQLFSMYSNGAHLESTQPVDFFEGRLPDSTRAKLEIASELANMFGTTNVLSYIASANQMQNTDFQEQIKSVLGTDSVKKFLSNVDGKWLGDYGTDIANDRIAKDYLEEVVKYAVIQKNATAETVGDLVVEIFTKRFVETEGYVVDFANQNSNRSRHALAVVFREPEVKEEFIKNATEELGALGYTFGPTKYGDHIPFQGSPKIIGEKGNAILVPLEGTNQSVAYIAYRQDEDGSLTLIRKPSDEFGETEPLVFGANEQYLQDFRERFRLNQKEISQELIKEARTSKLKDKKLEEFRNRDANELSIMGN